MEFTGKGRLKHRFWGEYSAVICLQFATAALAETARLVAFDAFERPENPYGPSNILRFTGGGSELRHAEMQLRAAGADMRKVGSLRHSIDYGEPFTVTVRTAPVDDGSVQLPLLP